MPTFRITTSLDENTETKFRASAAATYTSLVRRSLAMNGTMSGESVSLYRDGVRVIEHVGRKHLEEQVIARLIALDSAPQKE